MMFKAIYMHTKPLKHTKDMRRLNNYIKKTTMFKVIPMHTKPLKHANIEILTNTSKNTIFENSILMSKFRRIVDALQKS